MAIAASNMHPPTIPIMMKKTDELDEFLCSGFGVDDEVIDGLDVLVEEMVREPAVLELLTREVVVVVVSVVEEATSEVVLRVVVVVVVFTHNQ